MSQSAGALVARQTSYREFLEIFNSTVPVYLTPPLV